MCGCLNFHQAEIEKLLTKEKGHTRRHASHLVYQRRILFKENGEESDTLVTANSKQADAGSKAEASIVETYVESIFRKRRSKPNSLMNPVEGCDNYCIFRRIKSQVYLALAKKENSS